MNIPFLNSLFNKNTKTLKLPESLLIKELKSVADENNLPIFENITIYHHSTNFFIPLLILDEGRGIFLFEYKDWSYDDLKNAKIEKAKNQESAKNTLAFEKSHTFIRRKFNELTHNDGVPIFNYLLMENLNTDQYQHLNDSFQELLPQEKIIFNDSSHNDILGKLIGSTGSQINLPSVSNVMSTLLIQYAILDKNNDIHLASKEQMKFIDSPLVSNYTLKAPAGSGKTSSILLKAILEKLKNRDIKIIIIKPTPLACDILKKRLLDSIEHAIVEVDVTSIKIITPEMLIDKDFKTDFIICDDSEFYTTDFMEHIKKIKSSLLIVEDSNDEYDELNFSKNFKNEEKETLYFQTNPHAKALHLISSLLKEHEAEDILVVSNTFSREKLNDDLDSFIENRATLVDSSKNLMNQKLDTLLLSSYEDVHSIDVKFVILMDICSTDVRKLKYAYNLSQKNVYVLYEDECKNLDLIKDDFESNNERNPVEEETLT